MQMKLHSASYIVGLALLTISVQPQVVLAGNDKAVEKYTPADANTFKKAPLVQQQAVGAKGADGTKGEMGVSGTEATESRNWAAIDTNKDHYIQPEEMEKYLNDAWAAQKKAGQKTK
jgi:hypothetical protein